MDRIEVEKLGDRAAWEVRQRGVLIGIVWREARDRFRAAPEGTTKPLGRTFATREEAVEALTKRKGR